MAKGNEKEKKKKKKRQVERLIVTQTFFCGYCDSVELS